MGDWYEKMFHEQGPLPTLILLVAMFAGVFGVVLLIAAYGDRMFAEVRWHLVGWGAALVVASCGLGWLGFEVMP